jgi:hypothetical protein
MKLIKDQQINSKILKDLEDLGVGYVHMTAALNVADAITIGAGPTLETWTASAGGAGAGEFDQSGGTAVLCATSLVDKINALGASQVRAVLGTGGGAAEAVVLLFGKTAAAGNLALAVTVGGARMNVSAAAMVGALAARVTQISYLRYAVTAADVTTFAAAQEVVLGAIGSTTEPRILGFCVADATGGLYAPAGLDMLARQSGANEWLIAMKDTTAILANTDIVTVTLGF